MSVSAGSPPAVGQRTSSAPASSASFAGTGEPSSSGGGGSGTPHVLRGKVRAQDVYGGPLAFGGTPSRSRKSLLDNGSSKSYHGLRCGHSKYVHATVWVFKWFRVVQPLFIYSPPTFKARLGWTHSAGTTSNEIGLFSFFKAGFRF